MFMIHWDLEPKCKIINIKDTTRLVLTLYDITTMSHITLSSSFGCLGSKTPSPIVLSTRGI